MDEKAKEIGNQAAHPVVSDGRTHPTIWGMTIRERLIVAALSRVPADEAIAEADRVLAALAREVAVDLEYRSREVLEQHLRPLLAERDAVLRDLNEARADLSTLRAERDRHRAALEDLGNRKAWQEALQGTYLGGYAMPEDLRIFRHGMGTAVSAMTEAANTALAPGAEEGGSDAVELPCLCCGKLHAFAPESNEAQGVFNVFCPNGECEDRYAARL